MSRINQNPLIILSMILFSALIVSSCQIFSGSTVKNPSIELWADDTSLEPGECTTIHWDAGPGTVYINGTEQDASDSIEECLWETQTYLLQLEESPDNLIGEDELTIYVNQEPDSSFEDSSDIEDPELFFWADDLHLETGECTIVHWETSGGTAYLNGHQQAPEDSKEVCPKNDTEYTLDLDDPQGDPVASETITISVEQQDATQPTQEQSQSKQDPSPTQKQTQPKQDPQLSFDFSPKSGPPGTEVTILLSEPADVLVLYQEQPLPKKVADGGKKLIVNIPSDAQTGYFKLQGDGHNVRADNPFEVTLLVSMSITTDLGITDLYPDSMPVGNVYIRISNFGPSALSNESIKYSCSVTGDPLPGTTTDFSIPATKKNAVVSLIPGETKAYNTGIGINTDTHSNKISCKLLDNSSIYEDPNPANDSYQETIPK